MDDRSTATKRREESTAIITSGHVWTAVWYRAWPTVINTLIMTAYNLINRAFLGRLGSGTAEALAAVGISGAVLNIQFSVMMGLSIGTSALVARFLGANNHKDAEEATTQSLFLAVIAGLVTALPLVVWATPVIRLMGTKSPVVPLAAGYLAIVAYSSIPAFLYTIITSALRSAGDVRSPLYTGAVIIVLNVALDYLLIFGFGFRIHLGSLPAIAVHVPPLGVVGAAISTSISRVAGMLLIFWFLRKSALGGALDRLKMRAAWFARIMNIGWPAMLQSLLWTAAGVALVKLLGGLPNATDAQAALTLGLTIEATAFMPGVAYSTAAAPLVGQNLGAGNPDRAEHSAWVATGQAVVIMTLVAVLFVVIPRQLTMLFTSDKSLVPLVVSYLQINAISEPFLALGMVLRGALQGAGDTRIPAVITVITFWLVRIPMVLLLAKLLGMGALGAWIAISGSTVLSGILTAIWFRRGHWRTIQV
jgi:putative MATE family efflux protein